jgi:hypothetical protein
MSKKPTLTKAEQARVDRIKKAKGPIPYKGRLSGAFKTPGAKTKRVTVDAIFNNPKGWMTPQE